MIIVPHKGSMSSSVVGALISHSQEVVIYEERELNIVHHTYQGYTISVQAGEMHFPPHGGAVNIYEAGYNAKVEPKHYEGYTTSEFAVVKVSSGSLPVSIFGSDYYGYLMSDAGHEDRVTGHIIGRPIYGVCITHTEMLRIPVIRELFTREPKVLEGAGVIMTKPDGGELVFHVNIPVEFVPAPYIRHNHEDLEGRYPGSDSDKEYQEILKKFRPRRYPDTHIPIRRRVIIE